MSSVIMPNDRTTKQAARGFCRNPQCRVDKKDFEFPIEHAHVSCPKCGANERPMVGILVITHLLVAVKGGPLVGAGGLRYALACDEKRAYMATRTNMEACSNDTDVVDCNQCLKNAEKLGLLRNKVWIPDQGVIQ